MAIFSGKIVSAQFIDPPNNMLIEVLYQEGDIVTPYNLEVDFTQQDFNDLLKEVTLEEIEKNTKTQLKVERDNINSIIRKEIDRLWVLESEKIKKAYEEVDNYKDSMKSDLAKKYQSEFLNNRVIGIEDMSPKDIFNYLTQKNEDNDFVFNFKVSILEDPLIGKSKDKALKLSIRKSKTLFELLKFYGEAKGAS